MRINRNKHKIQKKKPYPQSLIGHSVPRTSRLGQNIYINSHPILCTCVTIQITFPDENRIGYGPSADGYDKIVITEGVHDVL